MAKKLAPAVSTVAEFATVHIKGMPVLDAVKDMGLTHSNLALAITRGLGTDVLERPFADHIRDTFKGLKGLVVADMVRVGVFEGKGAARKFVTYEIGCLELVKRIDNSHALFAVIAAATAKYTDPTRELSTVAAPEGTKTDDAPAAALVDLNALLAKRKERDDKKNRNTSTGTAADPAPTN